MVAGFGRFAEAALDFSDLFGCQADGFVVLPEHAQQNFRRFVLAAWWELPQRLNRLFE
jgi:hypothetical protein